MIFLFETDSSSRGLGFAEGLRDDKGKGRLRPRKGPLCLFFCLLAAFSLLGCLDPTLPAESGEMANVARESLPIRAELAPTSEVLHTVHLGDELEILEQRRGSVRVRTAEGLEGWTGRYALVTAETKARMDRQKDLTADLKPQGTVMALDILNVHIDPERESETIYQLQPDEPAELLARSLVPRERLEGWSLIRLSTGHSGWVLETRMYSGISIDVAQFAERRRIVAYFSLGEVEDEKLTEPKTTWLWAQAPGDESTADFDRIRVFRWSTRRGAYQTIKLERGLEGYLPITVHPGDGTREAQFDVLVKKENGFALRKYQLRGMSVVLVEEVPAERKPLILQEPPPIVEEAEPPSILERLRSWWSTVA